MINFVPQPLDLILLPPQLCLQPFIMLLEPRKKGSVSLWIFPDRVDRIRWLGNI